MKQPITRTRTRAVAWYYENGRNASATSREFGVSRSTLYRWLERYDPEHPGESLRRRRAPRAPRPAPKEALFLGRMMDFHLRHPRWGRMRLHRALRELRDDAPSPATIGRWLHSIREKCPVCGKRDYRHVELVHIVKFDLVKRGLSLPRRRMAKARRKPRQTTERAAVNEASAILKTAARTCPRCAYQKMVRTGPAVSCPRCGFRRER